MLKLGLPVVDQGAFWGHTQSTKLAFEHLDPAGLFGRMVRRHTQGLANETVEASPVGAAIVPDARARSHSSRFHGLHPTRPATPGPGPRPPPPDRLPHAPPIPASLVPRVGVRRAWRGKIRPARAHTAMGEGDRSVCTSQIGHGQPRRRGPFVFRGCSRTAWTVSPLPAAPTPRSRARAPDAMKDRERRTAKPRPVAKPTSKLIASPATDTHRPWVRLNSGIQLRTPRLCRGRIPAPDGDAVVTLSTEPVGGTDRLGIGARVWRAVKPEVQTLEAAPSYGLHDVIVVRTQSPAEGAQRAVSLAQLRQGVGEVWRPINPALLLRSCALHNEEGEPVGIEVFTQPIDQGAALGPLALDGARLGTDADFLPK